MSVGLIFSSLKLPLLAPNVLPGIVGIIEIYHGGVLFEYMLKLIGRWSLKVTGWWSENIIYGRGNIYEKHILATHYFIPYSGSHTGGSYLLFCG
ncbi:MAG: DUF1427 family protein [Thermoanaerobacter sp.]|nr:DUF1427 family protein [Thermoanaerobacter sp.]